MEERSVSELRLSQAQALRRIFHTRKLTRPVRERARWLRPCAAQKHRHPGKPNTLNRSNRMSGAAQGRLLAHSANSMNTTPRTR